jgi:ATP-dependent RNA helicase HelY
VSSFRITYSTAANLVRRHQRPRILEILGQSFAQFLADRDIVSLERELTRRRARLAEARSESGGDVSEPGRELRRLQSAVDRLERRIRRRHEHLGTQYDRVAALLEEWGYVTGGKLTDAGDVLAGLAAECELVLAEAVRREILLGLDAPSLSAMVSCVVFESRGPEPRDARWPNSVVAARFRALEAIWSELSLAEAEAELPVTRPPDPGMCDVVHDWAAGTPLADLLDDELTGGDFVRHVKQCIDLLHQVEHAAPSLAPVAREAREACRRGVVEASSTVGA